MKKQNGFITAGFWSILGTFLVKGTYLITIPLYSRILSVEEYGDMNIFITYAAILTIILSANLVAAVSTGVVKYKEKKAFLSSVMSLSLLLFLGFFALLLIFSSAFGKLYRLGLTQMVLLYLYSFGQYVLNFISSALVMEYQYKKQALILFLTLLADTILSTVFILTIFKNNRLDGRYWGAAIPTTLAAVIIILAILLAGKVKYNREYWKFALAISLPMVFHGLSHIVLGQSDRIMIRRMIGAREAGIYGLIHNLAVMLAALVTALNQIWIPWMFRKLREGDTEEVKKQGDRYMLWFFLITVALLGVSPEIIKVLASEKYWEGIPLMVPIVLSSFLTFLYTLYVNVEIFHEKTRGVAVGTCAAAAINIVLNYVMLQIFGYHAAAYTTLASYLLLLVFHFLLCRFHLKKKVYSDAHVWMFALAAGAFGALVYALIDHMWIRFGILAAIAAAVLVKRPPLPQMDIRRNNT